MFSYNSLSTSEDAESTGAFIAEELNLQLAKHYAE
jgi:hypothetical protein